MANTGPVTLMAARSVRVGQTAFSRKWSFLGAFALIFIATYTTLVSFDLVPNPPKPAVRVTATPNTLTAAVADAVQPEAPTTLDIPAIKLHTSVANPSSTNIEVLDTALLKGAVRYPSSSNLGEPGNVIIFGHSSYLPIVNNPAYKTFDGIQNLKAGDEITVTGSTHTYTYAVQSVEKKNAETDAIPLTVTGNVLTLATCNSFATKSDRFVVTAVLVKSDPVGA